jgi:hypothetical protein
MKENPPGNKASSTSSDGCFSKIEQNQILAISAALSQLRPLETAKGMAIEMLPSTFRV